MVGAQLVPTTAHPVAPPTAVNVCHASPTPSSQIRPVLLVSTPPTVSRVRAPTPPNVPHAITGTRSTMMGYVRANVG